MITIIDMKMMTLMTDDTDPYQTPSSEPPGLRQKLEIKFQIEFYMIYLSGTSEKLSIAR